MDKVYADMTSIIRDLEIKSPSTEFRLSDDVVPIVGLNKLAVPASRTPNSQGLNFSFVGPVVAQVISLSLPVPFPGLWRHWVSIVWTFTALPLTLLFDVGLGTPSFADVVMGRMILPIGTNQYTIQTFPSFFFNVGDVVNCTTPALLAGESIHLAGGVFPP